MDITSPEETSIIIRALREQAVADRERSRLLLASSTGPVQPNAVLSAIYATSAREVEELMLKLVDQQ